MRVGIIGDTHFPFCHPRYLDFIVDMFNDWAVDQVIHIGDVVDIHSTSFHPVDPDGLSPAEEYDRALQDVDQWYRTFPEATVLIGNHDMRYRRKAKGVAIPSVALRQYNELWNTEEWEWTHQCDIDGVSYIHGTGSSGTAFNRAIRTRQSTVKGHTHTLGGCQWHSSRRDRIFGLDTGCGIDCTAYAMAYGENTVNRPVLGCGIVVDGEAAFFECMDAGGKYKR